MNAESGTSTHSIGRVMIVRRPTEGEAAQDETLCTTIVVETSNPESLVVLSPEDTEGMETLAVQVNSDDEDEEEDGAVIDDFVLPSSSSASAKNVGGADLVVVDMIIPPGAEPGQALLIEIGGQEISVAVPIDALPGQRVQLSVPRPQPPGSGDLTKEDLTKEGQASLLEQSSAIVYKNSTLAFGCSRGPGRSGCCSFKCCELCCYIFLFTIMALACIINSLLTSPPAAAGSLASFQVPTSKYCDNGLLENDFDASDGWPALYPINDGGSSRRRLEEELPSFNTSDANYDQEYQPPAVFSSCDSAAVVDYLINYQTTAYEHMLLTQTYTNYKNDILTTFAGYGHYPPNADPGPPMWAQRNAGGGRTWSSCNESEAAQSCWLRIGIDNSVSMFQPTLASDGESRTTACASQDYRAEQSKCRRSGQQDGTCASGHVPRAEIWFSDAKAAKTKLSELSIFPHDKYSGVRHGVEYSTGNSNLNSTGRFIDNREYLALHDLHLQVTFVEKQPGEITSQVMEAQQRNAKHTTKDVCSNADVAGRLFGGVHEAAEHAASAFPTAAIEISDADVGSTAVVFHYAIRMWTEAKQQTFLYTNMFARYPHPTELDPGFDALHCEIVDGKRHCDDTICCSAGPDPQKPGSRQGWGYLNWDLELSKVINAVSNSLLRKVVGNNGAALSVEMVPMPPLVFNDGTIEPSALWLVLYPLLTMLLIPSLCSLLASEKEEGLIEMMRTEGGRVVSLFVGNMLFMFGYGLVFSGIFVATIEGSGASGGDNAIQMPPAQVIGLAVCWAWAQMGFVLFTSLVLFKKAKYAALFGVLSVLMSTIQSVAYTEKMHQEPAPLYYFLLPPLAYARTTGMMLWYGGGEDSRRRDCHFDDTPFLSLLKKLLKVEGGAAE